MGTPSYMPPEQAGGKRGEVGPAADVYALGATLYALVTGRPPFQAATAMDTVLQVISDEPVPPRRLNASIPRDLETICLKCLEKEPGKRYASAAGPGRRPGPVPGRRADPGPAGGAGRSGPGGGAGAKPVLAAMALALAFATVAGLSGIVWQWSRARPSAGIAQFEHNVASAKQASPLLNETKPTGSAPEAVKQRAIAVERKRPTPPSVCLAHEPRASLMSRTSESRRCSTT